MFAFLISEEGVPFPFVAVSGVAEFGEVLGGSEGEEGLHGPGDSGDHMMLNNR